MSHTNTTSLDREIAQPGKPEPFGGWPLMPPSKVSITVEYPDGRGGFTLDLETDEDGAELKGGILSFSSNASWETVPVSRLFQLLPAEQYRVALHLPDVKRWTLRVNDDVRPLRSSAAWEAETDFVIVDPDGWRDVGAPGWSDPITWEEFQSRAAECTVLQRSAGKAAVDRALAAEWRRDPLDGQGAGARAVASDPAGR